MPSISSQSFICLVREISVSKIKVCFWCGCIDIHINPTKCSVVMNTVPKYLGSPNLYSGSTWEGAATCPLRGVHDISRISHPGCKPHDFCTSILDYSSLPQETHLCVFPQPQSPWRCRRLTLPAETWHPLPSTASSPWSISEIRPQDFFWEPAKCQISDGFNSKPGIWPDFLENGPSFI